MNVQQKAIRVPPNRVQPSRRYWNGFSVCLFIVLLSVFTWMVHRRLTQYESMQQTGGHHMTATKVCLMERPQATVPSTGRIDGRLFFAVAVFAFALFRLDDSQKSTIRDSVRPPPFKRISSRLTHFFFLPPPALYSAL